MLENAKTFVQGLPPALLPLIAAGVAILYFLPTLIASLRGHKHLKQLFVVNLTTGWNEVAWLGTLVWAVTGRRKDAATAKSEQS